MLLSQYVLDQYEDLFNSWMQEKEKLENYKDDDVHSTEAVLQCEKLFSNTHYHTKKADQFIAKTAPRLSEM